MKKLLIMASLFWPQKNSGGPPVSILNLVRSIQGHFDTYIISKNHEIGDPTPLPDVQEGWNEFPFGKAYYVPYGQHNFANVFGLIEQVQPDVIYQNSFFSYDDLYPVLRYKKKYPHVKVIVAPRGEFYPERIRKGKWKKTIYSAVFRCSGLLRDVYFQGTGADECEQCHRLLGIPRDHLLDIQNLSVVNNTAPRSMQKEPGVLRLVFIARIHPTKNVLNAIRWLADVQGRVEFDIYGPIEGEAYWQQCQEAIARLPESIRVCHKGMVEHERVAETIQQYHAYYMPTTGENFGHSIVESLLSARPVIISDQTPWSDVHHQGGFVYSLDNADAFTAAIQALCDMEQAAFDEMCDGAKEYIGQKLDTDEIVAQYVAAFEA